MARGDARKRECIRAAQAWLDQAEASLAKDQPVQGDLKLMLAKAELARTSDCGKTRQWKARAGRLAALLAAVLMAWGWHSFLDESSSAQIKQPAALFREQAAGAAALQKTEEQASIEAVAKVAPAEIDYGETAPQAAGIYGTVEPGSPIGAASPHMTYQQDEEQDGADREAAEEEQVYQSEPLLPDARTQLLMQQAGQVLRR